MSGSSDQPILGGTAVQAGAWPNTVLLDVGCSGVIVHEHLVLYAAHCGTDVGGVWLGTEFGIEINQGARTLEISPDADARWVPVRRCTAHPSADIGSGTDIAFCELEEPIATELVYPAMGCERQFVQVGREATLIGLGFDLPEAGTAGVKRSVRAAIREVGPEIVIGDDGLGTCRGDSGGPAFLQVGSSGEWRLIGIMSSGYIGECGESFYTDASELTAWVEEASQRDITPCHAADGTWQPTADCLKPKLDPEGLPLPDAGRSAACGAAWEAETDPSPPVVNIGSAHRTNDARVLVDADAADDGSGVKRVRAELTSADGALVAWRDDELPPYAFEFDAIEGSPLEVRVTALDYAGNATEARRPVSAEPPAHSDSGSGCALTTPCRESDGAAYGWITFAALGLARLRRRHQSQIRSSLWAPIRAVLRRVGVRSRAS